MKRLAYLIVAVLSLAFVTVQPAGAVPAVQPTHFMFQTEILALDLTGSGMAPLFNPQTGQFVTMPVMMHVSPGLQVKPAIPPHIPPS